MKSVTSKIRSSGFGRAFISADRCTATPPVSTVSRRALLASMAVCCLPAAAAGPPLKIGFVYVAPVTDAGWVRQHEEGRKAVQAALGDRVQTLYVENVAEGADAERVIRELAQQGCGLIFTPSFGYMEPTLKVARDYPQVRFESITGYKTAANVSVANARYYEGRYLAGVAAGRMARSGVAGYVAGFPIPEVLQGINAFTRGMRSVAPQARVKLIWLQAWFDPPRERDAAMTLMNQGADVLAFHTGSSAVMAAAQERGRLAIAYHSDMRKIGPDAQVLAVVHEWGAYYTQRARCAGWQLDTWQRVGRHPRGHDARRRFRPARAAGGAGRGAGAPARHRGRAPAPVPGGRGRARQHGPRGHCSRPDTDGCADPGDGLAGGGRGWRSAAMSGPPTIAPHPKEPNP